MFKRLYTGKVRHSINMKQNLKSMVLFSQELLTITKIETDY